MRIKLFLAGVLLILVAGAVCLYGVLSTFTDFKLEYTLVGFLPVFSSDSQSSLILIVIVALIILAFIVPILKLFKL